MKINYEFVKRDIAGDTFLVPIGEAVKKFSGLFALNEVGSFIWDKLPEAEDEDAVVNAVLEEYETTPEEAKADVSEFLSKLREMGII